MQFIVSFCFLSKGDNISIIVRHDATFIIAVVAKNMIFWLVISILSGRSLEL